MKASFVPELSLRAFVAAYLVLLFVTLIPLGLTPLPPLVDYPNHLARMHILLDGTESEALRESYLVHWALLPNLAMDLVVPALAAFMPLELAGRVFIGITLLLISSGTVALHYVLHGRITLWPLLGFLFLYNFIFLLGLVNYLFGVGVFLWSLAAWIHFRDRSYVLRLPLFSALALGLYFSHLYALGLYGLAVVGYEFWRWRKHRKAGSALRFGDWLGTAVPFLPPAFLFLFLSPTAGTFSLTDYGPLRNIIIDKIFFLLAVVSNHNIGLDVSTFLLLSILLLFGLTRGKVKLAKTMSTPLILFGIAAAFMPFWLFSAALADVRLSVPVVFLFIASTALHWQSAFWNRCLVVGLLTIFVVRMVVVIVHWQSSQAVYAEYLEAFDEMPEGSRLLPAYARPPGSLKWQSEPPSLHVATLAVITRSAYVPTLFSYASAQPISVVADNRTPSTLAGPPHFRWLVEETPSVALYRALVAQLRNVEFLHENWRTYDYLLLLDTDAGENPLPSVLSSVYEGSDFNLYKIRPPQ